MHTNKTIPNFTASFLPKDMTINIIAGETGLRFEILPPCKKKLTRPMHRNICKYLIDEGFIEIPRLPDTP